MAKKQQAAIDRQVGKLLRKVPAKRREFVRSVSQIADEYGDEVYSTLLYTAVHLEFGKRAARKHFEAVSMHWKQLAAATGRDVDVRVAMLDYFLTINRRIKNPKIIEIKIFEKTCQETEIDELTRVFNYRYFKKAIDLEVCRSQRYHSPLSLVLFDADDFKLYNDTNGHPAGNKALAKLAAIIKSSVREVDVVARFGGEEFALLLPETNKEGAFVIADRIRQKVATARFANRKQQPGGHFGVSGGVATLHVDAGDSDALVKKADQALYRAKARGKNQIALYVDELREYERVSTAIMGQVDYSDGRASAVLLQDVSEGGVLFTHDEPLAVGTQCRLGFPIPGQEVQVSCRIKVRRVEELVENNQFGIGASIVQIQPKDRKALKRFIRTLAELKAEAGAALA